MDHQFNKPVTRRDFLKISTSLAAMGIATSLTPELLYAQSKTDLKGVSIDYWAMIHQQNPVVKQLSVSIIKAFEKKTGCTVKVTWAGYGDIIGPKYRTNFKANMKPTVFDATCRWTGALRAFLRPLDDLIENDLDAKVRDNISWLFPVIRGQNSGFADKDQIRDLPFLLIVQAPTLTRRDHWEKAGLDFDNEWPIKDSDHFVEVLKVLKDQKVVQYPYEVYGKLWDAMDTQLPGWIRSLDPSKGNLINDNWTRSNGGAESWIKGTQFYVDLFRKYGFSSPNSPQSSDEESVEQLIQGRKTIVHCDLLNRGTLLKRLPKLVEDGTIQWATHFPIAGGDADAVGFQSNFAFNLVKQEGPDAKIKEKAAWEFIKEWFLEENQIALTKALGPCARKDLWQSQMGAADHYMESTIPMLKKPVAWPNHPKGIDIQYNLCAPHIQNALKGADVAGELKAYAAEVDKVLAD
jgi:ABC-type glycerol-3-phosphate transport system substrate-binding protein